MHVSHRVHMHDFDHFATTLLVEVLCLISPIRRLPCMEPSEENGSNGAAVPNGGPPHAHSPSSSEAAPRSRLLGFIDVTDTQHLIKLRKVERNSCATLNQDKAKFDSQCWHYVPR